MRARLLLNLLLLAVVAGLVAILILEPGREAESPARRLTAIDAGEVERVRVEPRAGAPFELQRNGDRWALTVPRALPADPFRIQALLGVLRAESQAGFRAAGNDLSEFGLAPPTVRLLVDGVSLDFGTTEAIDGRRYVLYDEEVHLIADTRFPHLSARAENFVHPSPLGPGAEVSELTLPGLTLRRADGRWETVPERPDLGADALRQLIGTWRSTRALRVSAFDPTLTWDRRVAVRTLDEPATHEILVSTSEHELVLGRPELGVQWHFVRRIGDALLGPPARTSDLDATKPGPAIR